MAHYSIELRKKYVRGYRFLSFAGNLSSKYKKQSLDTGLDLLKAASNKAVHKTGEFFGNKIADTVTNLNDNRIVKRFIQIKLKLEETTYQKQ